MLIEINTEILKKFGISADDFLYLYLLHAKSYDCLGEITIKPDTEALQTKGLLKLGEKTEDHAVRQSFLDMFQVPFDQMWSELLSHFPLKVNTKGSVRILRAKDANARSNAKAKKSYERYVQGDSQKHNHVVRCLINELNFRKANDSLGFMQMLQTWVNNHTWEQYEDLEDESAESNSRITRKL